MSILLLAALLFDDAAAFVADVPLDGPLAVAAVPRLIDIVRDAAAGEPLRQRAADRLARIGKEAVAAIPVLIDIADRERERWAVKALSQYGTLAVEAAPLYQQLADVDELRPVALEGLARTLPVRPAGLSVFQRQLLGDDPDVALDTLYLAGGAAQPLVPIVARLAEISPPATQRRAILVLAAAGGSEAARTLQALLTAEEPDVFADAAAALGGLRERETLASALAVERVPTRRRLLVTALRDAGGDLTPYLADPDDAVRLTAAAAMKRPDVLVPLLDSEDRTVAHDAAVALEAYIDEPLLRDARPRTTRGQRLLERIQDQSD